MDGIILINKEKGLTSRDVVNKISKKLQIKKVGHAGTLDPIATGLLVIGVGKGTKILDLLTLDQKEYIATVSIGFKTDTYDITGNITEENYNYHLDEDKLKNVLDSFKGSYNQEVPKFSAVKIDGKKLYEYARKQIDIELPKRLVTIYKIELLTYNDSEFTFKVLVSKGTYIRSLIHDISLKLNIPMTMKELIRTKSGKFLLENSNLIDDNYNYIPIDKALDFKIIELEDEILLKKVRNGNKINLPYNDIFITLKFKDDVLAIYKKEKFEYKAFKVF